MYGRGKKLQKPAAGKVSRSAKVGLQFPVGRIHRLLRIGNYAEKIEGDASVYLTAILEYLCVEVLKLSVNAAKEDEKTKILVPHIQLVVRNDEGLGKLFGGVPTAPQAVLVPEKTEKGSSSQEPEAAESEEF